MQRLVVVIVVVIVIVVAAVVIAAFRRSSRMRRKWSFEILRWRRRREQNHKIMYIRIASPFFI